MLVDSNNQWNISAIVRQTHEELEYMFSRLHRLPVANNLVLVLPIRGNSLHAWRIRTIAKCASSALIESCYIDTDEVQCEACGANNCMHVQDIYLCKDCFNEAKNTRVYQHIISELIIIDNVLIWRVSGDIHMVHLYVSRIHWHNVFVREFGQLDTRIYRECSTCGCGCGSRDVCQLCLQVYQRILHANIMRALILHELICVNDIARLVIWIMIL